MHYGWLDRWVVVVVFGALVAGCGGGDPLGRKAVSGTVQVDGQPLQHGTISFEPVSGGVTSSGSSVRDGKFSMEQSVGLPPGKYRVVVHAPVPGTGGTVEEGALPGDPVPEPKELIPEEWNVKSDQFIEVKADGPFEFNFSIPTKK